VEALKKKERGDETQFTTKKFGGKKLVWVPVILFCEMSFPVQHLMPCYAQNWPFLPPNRLTLRISLLPQKKNQQKSNPHTSKM
jgi:hypothetical protein